MCPKPLATARKLEQGQVRKPGADRLALSNSTPGPHQRLALFGESGVQKLHVFWVCEKNYTSVDPKYEMRGFVEEGFYKGLPDRPS